MSNAIDKVIITKPHVVILGAGASKQAFPKGDKKGRLVPLMAEIPNLVSIKDIIAKHNLPGGKEDFEKFYSSISMNNKFSNAVKELESELYKYFSSLEIGDNPTLYDYLLLSLRETDVIATFNWDPFIVQAYERVSTITNKLPKVLFLHGTVALGRCRQDFIINRVGKYCNVCGELLEPLKLLYPVSDKDYKDQFIDEQWKALKEYLRICNGITIFGYGAPVSDSKAIDLLIDSYGAPHERIMEEIDIIDKKPQNELIESWKKFIHGSHYSTFEDYFDCSIANFPRRISEYQFMRFNLNMWLDNHKIQPNLTFDELKIEFQKLLGYEV